MTKFLILFLCTCMVLCYATALVTYAASEQETEPAEEESGLKELALPVGILAIMAVVTFIIVFRKPTETNAK